MRQFVYISMLLASACLTMAAGETAQSDDKAIREIVLRGNVQERIWRPAKGYESSYLSRGVAHRPSGRLYVALCEQQTAGPESLSQRGKEWQSIRQSHRRPRHHLQR